jgi:epoxyqueuosine reductase
MLLRIGRSIITVMSLEQEIKNRASELGFDAVGITDASPIGHEHVEHFESWLRSGCAGPLSYMHRNLEKRIDAGRLMPGARSVIAVALSYKPLAPAAAVGWAPPTAPKDELLGSVAQYAQYEDYHSFIKSLLRNLADFVQHRTDRTHRFKICVDSAPLAEKALAVRAGLGFIGRNHLLIHPQLGPQVLLGELITTLELQPDEPAGGTCAKCDLCLRACPTGALRRDGFLDARDCISCLTQYQPSPKIGHWLFGCDECLLACPYQQRAPVRANRQFRRCVEPGRLNLRGLVELTPEAFAAEYSNSPMGKAGLEALQRNARICLQNADQGARKMSRSVEGNSQPRISVPRDMPRRR